MSHELVGVVLESMATAKVALRNRLDLGDEVEFFLRLKERLSRGVRIRGFAVFLQG